jgi:hypothetical protein
MTCIRKEDISGKEKAAEQRLVQMKCDVVAWFEGLQKNATPKASTSQVRLDQVVSNCRELSSDSKAGEAEGIDYNPCLLKQSLMIRCYTGASLNLLVLGLSEGNGFRYKSSISTWDSLFDD